MIIFNETKKNEMKSTLISEKCSEIVLIKKLRNVSSIEQKHELNQRLRKMLPETDNGVIVYAAIIMNNDLSFRELKKRIEGNYFNDLGELFDLIDQMLLCSNGKSHNRVFSLAWKKAIAVSKSKSAVEIAEIIKEYGGTIHIIGDDLAIIEEMLQGRNDLNEIARIISSSGLKLEELI